MKPTKRLAGVGVAGLLSLATLPVSATLIDFDDLPPYTPVEADWAEPGEVVICGGVIVQCNLLPAL